MMKTQKTTGTTTLTLALAAVLTGAGLVTTALAAPRAISKPKQRAFVMGAAERKAAELPRAWRFEAKAVSFESMYAQSR